MAEYQQAQKPKSASASSSAHASANANAHVPVVQTESKCANCGALNDGEALYCCECGGAMAPSLLCPKCGAQAAEGADICRVCHAWLLVGQCKFCYAELPPEAVFCAECGKPQEGIPCPQCGTLSTFDFCSTCGKPVTEEAIQATEAANAEGANREPAITTAQTAAIQAELAELESIINSEPEPEPELELELEETETETPAVRKPLFSDSQLATIRKTGEDIDELNRKRAEEARIAEEKRKAEAERKRKAEAERKRKEQERLEQIRKAEEEARRLEQQLEEERLENERRRERAIAEAQERAYMTFDSNHDARRFYLAWRHPDAIGWRCNFTGTVHLYANGGPNDCDNPSLGGCDYFG